MELSVAAANTVFLIIFLISDWLIFNMSPASILSIFGKSSALIPLILNLEDIHDINTLKFSSVSILIYESGSFLTISPISLEFITIEPESSTWASISVSILISLS